MLLDFDTLYNEAQGGAFNSGKKRFYDNKVLIPACAPVNGKINICGNVVGKEREYSTKIIFDEQGGLYDYQCDCQHFSLNDGPCKHIVATALAYEEKNPAKQVYKSTSHVGTDSGALNLITDYTKRKHNRFMKGDESPVELTPLLEIDSQNKLSLRFTIGRARQYVLKDISDFVSCMKSNGARRYGAELELIHNYDNFTLGAQALIRFLIKSYQEKTDYLKEINGVNISRDEIKLLQNDVDNFFELYDGETVQLNMKKCKIISGVDTLKVEMDIVKGDGGYKLKLNIGSFKLLEGKKYYFIVTDANIYRCSEKFVDTVSLCLKAFDIHKNLFIADSDMPLFYNNVIQQLSDYVEIIADGIDLAVFEAAPFLAKLYLDADIYGVINARLECSYDDVIVNILDNGVAVDAVRDWESENSLINALTKYFPYYPKLIIDSEYAIYNFMSNGIAELFNYSEVYVSDTLNKMRVKKPPRIRVGVRLESDLLDVDLIAENFTNEQLVEILTAYREKKNYTRLKDGSFVDLIDPSISALSDILDVAGEIDGQKIRLPKYYAPFLDNALKSGFFTLDRDGMFKDLIKSLRGAVDAEIEVPTCLKDIMRNYQKTGYRWLKTLCKYQFGGILADDMGLGKSLQVIALIMSRINGTSIIVCPTTLILNWVNEFTKFAPNIKVLAVHGSYEQRQTQILSASNFDVVITSYELLRRDTSMYEKYKFDYAIIDEAQYIKNPLTQNSKAVKTLNSNYRFALTGTPIENSLAELWSIFDFIMPKYLYSYIKFKDTFESEIVKGNVKATEQLQKLVRPFILRRLKSAVLTELPPKIETNVYSALEGEQMRLYNANLSLIKDSVLASGNSVNKIVVLSMLTKLRQICCEPRLVYPDYNENSAKLETCMELVHGAVESGHKVLLFSQFTSMLEIIKQKLDESDISNFVLKGDTPKLERMRLVTRFNEGDTSIFLISLKAGGTGLNLTGADMVIHYDPWWNESVMNQATDRAYRIGQDKSVQVYKLLLENTVEEKIVKLQEKKNALSSLVVSGGEGAVSVKDLLSILES